MNDMNATDQVIKQYREQISDTDRKILDALNQRIKLVEKLKEYKASQGIGFLDPAQEDGCSPFCHGRTAVPSATTACARSTR